MANKPSDPADSTRGFGGYIYSSSFAGGNAWPGDGSNGTLAAGAYIEYVVESYDIATACGAGKFWWIYTNPSYIACMVPLR